MPVPEPQHIEKIVGYRVLYLVLYLTRLAPQCDRPYSPRREIKAARTGVETVGG
jgi:hypothetical protein